MIVLGDPNQEQAQMFQRGLLNSLGMLAQQQLRNEYLQKQYEMQLKKQKELLDYKQRLEQEALNKKINDLYGYDTPTIQLTEPQVVPNNPIDIQAQNFLSGKPMQDSITSAVSNFLNPQAQQQPLGLTQKFMSMLPKVEVGQKHIRGLLSDSFVNKGIPTAKDYVIAQAYGVNLPKVEKKSKKFEAKVVDNQYFTFDPETGEWIKKGEVKKVLKETPQRMLVDTGDKKLLIDKRDGKVIKEYGVNKGSNSKKSGSGSTKFNQYYSKFLNLRKQLRLLETGRMIDPDTGMAIPIPDDKKQALQEQILKDINLTLNIMEQENPERAKVVKKQLMKDPMFNAMLPRIPANLPKPEVNINQPKPKKTIDPFQLFKNEFDRH